MFDLICKTLLCDQTLSHSVWSRIIPLGFLSCMRLNPSQSQLYCSLYAYSILLFLVPAKEKVSPHHDGAATIFDYGQLCIERIRFVSIQKLLHDFKNRHRLWTEKFVMHLYSFQCNQLPSEVTFAVFLSQCVCFTPVLSGPPDLATSSLLSDPFQSWP